MTPGRLRMELYERGVELGIASGQLAATAPKGVLTIELSALVKLHKAELLELLTLEARCSQLETRMGDLKAAADANELYGAQEAADQQWMQIGDILELEYFPVWDRLTALHNDEQPAAEKEAA